MPSEFAGLEEELSEVLDGVYAEDTQIIRQVAGKVFAATPVAPDPADLKKGIIDINPLVVQVQDKSQYDGMQPNVNGFKVHVSYDLTLFADRSAWPVTDNLIKAIDRVGQPEYKVTRVEEDGLGRILCVCVPN